ncbi:MAG: phosphate ABC transporter permease PstA [Planctomycetota bacterium]|nr:MAG: phosphate ABC transporter permease PstA [Planctomycetota bacterium]
MGERWLVAFASVAAALVALAALWLVGTLLVHGLPELSWTLLTAAPLDAGRAGGIGPIIVATLLIVGVAMASAVPLALGTAVLISELTPPGSRLADAVRRCVDALAAVPSIVFGLFGNALLCKALGLGFSILSGGLTLACMVLPILTRATLLGLRSVPLADRLGAAALGLSRTSTLLHVVLPAARRALVVGLVLGIGRALSETAALIFTSGYVDRMPRSVFDSGRALSVHILDLSLNVPGGTERAYAASVVLLGLLLAINACASLLAHRWLGRDTVGLGAIRP